MPKLPVGWVWARPEQLASPTPYSIGIGPFGSNLKVSDYRSQGIPLVFVRHITSGNFDIHSKYISSAKYGELAAHSVLPLDVLITKMGDPPGDCEIYPANRKAAILTADCLKFRVWDEFVNRNFVKFAIRNDVTKRQLAIITKGVAQKKISSDRFKQILLPFSDIEEQERVAAEIEERHSEAANLENVIDAALAKADAMRQSILKRAFEGKLTQAWREENPELVSGENSAEALLARITAEKRNSSQNCQ